MEVSISCTGNKPVESNDLEFFLTDIPLTLEDAFRKSCFSKKLSNSSTFQTTHKERSSFSLLDVNSTKYCEKKEKSLRKIKHRKSAVVKLKNVSPPMLRGNRFVLVESKHNTPFLLYSLHHFKQEETKLSYENGLSSEISSQLSKFDQLSVAQNKEEVISYKYLLKPSNLDLTLEINLDKAQWTAGKHRTVLNFKGYRASVIVYTKPIELKRDLNSKFKDSFPNVEITLSKLRSLERKIQQCAKEHSLTQGVLFFAKSYFERLVFNCVVNKFNRHYVAAICFLLAAKIHGDLKPGEISQLINSLEHSFKIFNLLQYEFTVFAELKFSLIRNISFQNT